MNVLLTFSAPSLGVVGWLTGVKAGRRPPRRGLALRPVGWAAEACPGAGNGVGEHDASGLSGSVRGLSDVRESKSHVGYAQEVAPD